MKTILPWVVAVLALGGAYFFYNSNKAKSDDMAKLQQEVQEMQTLREENAELKARQVSADELSRLRKNTEDLLRLSNETRQLRDAQKQLTQEAQAAQAETQRAQAQAQAAQVAAQNAQAQAQAAQAQAQAQALLGTNAPQALTLEQQAFAQRYGLSPQMVQQLNACINNLRQLDAAKQQWGLENRKTAADIPTAQDVAPYIRGNAVPKCPAGGTYTLNSVGASPTCSIPGHALPK